MENIRSREERSFWTTISSGGYLFEAAAVSKISRHRFQLFEGSRAPKFTLRLVLGQWNICTDTRGTQMWEISFCQQSFFPKFSWCPGDCVVSPSLRIPYSFYCTYCALHGARELGKTAEFVSNLCPNAQNPQLVGVLSKDDAQGESHRGTSSHAQSDSDNSLDDHETSPERKFEGHLYFATANGLKGKLMNKQFGQRWRSSI